MLASMNYRLLVSLKLVWRSVATALHISMANKLTLLKWVWLQTTRSTTWLFSLQSATRSAVMVSSGQRAASTWT